MVEQATLRQRLREQECLIGIFLKTPSYEIVEVLGATGIDFIVIDAEHAPFDRGDISVCVLAAQAAGIPALVRVPNNGAGPILEALDVGAAGIVAPHAKNAAATQQIISATRYRDGIRGFSNSPRAGRYGQTSMAQHIEHSDQNAIVICQIEDKEAVDAIDSIASITEVDCLFLGRADLAVSYGAFDVTAPEVEAAVMRVCAAGQAANKAVGIFLGDTKQIEHYLKLGVTLFVIGSDQSLLRSSVTALGQTFSQTCLNTPRK